MFEEVFFSKYCCVKDLLVVQQMNATWASLNMEQCLKFGGQLVGSACGYVPDITLMSFILFFGTYACSMALKKFKFSLFFPTTVSDSTPQCVCSCLSLNSDPNAGSSSRLVTLVNTTHIYNVTCT